MLAITLLALSLLILFRSLPRALVVQRSQLLPPVRQTKTRLHLIRVVTSLYTYFHCEFDFLQLHCLSDSTLPFLCFQYTPPACLKFSVPSYNIFHSEGLLLSDFFPLSLLYKISATLILIPLKGFEDDLHIPFHRFSRHQLTRHGNCNSTSSPWRSWKPAYQAGPRYFLIGAFRLGRHHQ